ncbi:MAG: DNA mismatch repair protein MutS [Candidatus Omnitrophica bacterium]|nr:DNA mismatch repair protein MutS [Candidatus Omnitrophota bacterium]
MPEYTPMMQQYLKLRRSLPEDTLLFFRLGDFYEMFLEDAKRASQILDLVLTGREAGKAGRVPMCGVPYHSAESYIAKLTRSGLKVAICEQVEDPAQAKGLVDRQVTRIVTPATNLEEMEGEAPTYIVCVAPDRESCGLAYLDLGTGEFCVTGLARQDLAAHLAALQPVELVLPESLKETEQLNTWTADCAKTVPTFYEPWVFAPDHARDLLLRTFSLHSLESLSLSPEQSAAAGVLVYYLRDHRHESLGHLSLPRAYQKSQFMEISSVAQKHLELFEASDGGDKNLTLYGCLKGAQTGMGSRCLWRWLRQPLREVKPINARLDAVQVLFDSAVARTEFRAQLKKVGDAERLVARLTCGRAGGRDLVLLREFLRSVPGLKGVLKGLSAELIEEQSAALQPLPELEALLSRAVVDEPPLTLRDGGVIRDGYDAALDEQRALSKGGKQALVEIQRREVERTGIKTMKIKFNKVFGYYLEVSNANRKAVPEDYIRKQTLVNAERFITPELKEFEEKILTASERARSLEEELFRDLVRKVLVHTEALKGSAEAAGVLDCLAHLAYVAARYGYVRPLIEDTDELWIRGGRHPVVERVLPTGAFVENDLRMSRSKDQLLVLTGPNMSGKSTFIRQNALIVILAQMGSFVPAAECKVGLVDQVFTRIGASDALARGQSTFMVEMTEVAQILNHVTDRSLVIMDEVGRGTSTLDGIAIAHAVCEYLTEESGLRPRALFATHYHELTDLAGVLPRVKNYNVAVREDERGVTFLHKILPGGTDRSYGIHVASLAGLPRSTIERAEKILKRLEGERLESSPSWGAVLGTPAGETEGQLEFGTWVAEIKEHPLIEELRELIPEKMTPIEALNTLYRWKQALEEKHDAHRSPS